MNKAVKVNSLKTVLNPIWKLYNDPSINSICIDGFDDVYYYQGCEIKVAESPIIVSFLQ